LITYLDGVPAGWVTIAPRSDYVRLQTSRSRAAVDDRPVWSIPCFFVHRKFRRRGLTEALIRAAVAFARGKGATIVEAYPYDGDDRTSGASLFMGVASTFRKVGFVEVARHAANNPIMRLTL
jgi:GNAT superfamily N-acetyltransferase